MNKKTVYDEAIADVKKFKELAESHAKDLVLAKVEPRIKQLVEAQLFEDLSEDSDLEEASVVGNIAGQISNSEDSKDLDESEQYEIDESNVSALSQLADLTESYTDDRFVAQVYKMSDYVGSLVTADKTKKLNENFVPEIDKTISKLEHMYVYLKESYSGPDTVSLEGKLENSYGLANAVKESTMRMRDLLNEETLTMKVNGLPDDMNLDGLTVDVVADEPEADAGMDAAAGAEPAPDAGAEAAPPAPPQMEGDESDEDEDDEVIEISESELKTELAKLTGIREGDAEPPATKGTDNSKTFDNFGDAKKKGHAFTDNPGDHDLIGESRKHLAKATKRLQEARGTSRENFARALYKSAVASYRRVQNRQLAESKRVPSGRKVPATSVTNTNDSKKLAEAKAQVEKLTSQLAESNLLNAKLIHANKLLRIEGLSKVQQNTIIDRLDEAKNLREVRLISESLNSLVRSKASLVEAKNAEPPTGRVSRVVRSTANSEAPLNEGLETARWAQLAGLK